MSNIRGTSNDIKIYNENNQSKQVKNLELEEIEFLFETEKTEGRRKDFDSTFEAIDVSSKAVGGGEQNTQATEFFNGLKDNKSSLCEKLGISEEKYDGLSCVALALASQETGMGQEKGYVEENTGIRAKIRGFLKEIDNLRGGKSASSGLTQLKIYDHMQANGLPEDKRQILTESGIKATDIADNNLYSEPDKSAIATMVLLSDLDEKYDVYKDKMTEEHKKIGADISKDTNKLKEAEQNGNDILNKISTSFKSLDSYDQKKLRNQFKDVLLAENDTKSNGIFTKNKKYNEEYQMNKLNKLLKKMDIPVEITSENLDHIRYALTADGQEMNNTEYLAYAWNKGTETTGMQLDRLLSAKVGTILSSEDTFDEDQFEANVANLAERYANQSVDEKGIDYLNDALA